jgi:ubiquinone/menaquinone biosynthesis C-methylase UbiE
MSETVDLEAIKQVQQTVWSKGDFSRIGAHIQLVSERLCAEAVEVLPDERVLDVACGSGNTSIAAARSFGDVVGLDYVPALLERARERAAAERFEIEFIEGDAEELPFEDGSFDVVVSTFGAMFAPNQERAASELLRVCRSGGRIGMANWTPEGAVGAMFNAVSKHAPLPPGVKPPLLWGTEERLRELFGDGISELRIERRTLPQRFRSPEHNLEYFRTYFGPTKAAFERVGPEGEEALARDLLELSASRSRGGDRAVVIDSEYLEVVATRA